jgi:hypothetical protein
MKGRVSDWKSYALLLGFVGAVVFHYARGCEGDHNRARKIIRSQGYPEVRIEGPAGWKCGGEAESNKFIAVDQNGTMVKGVVCCSVLGCGKNCTIRWD